MPRPFDRLAVVNRGEAAMRLIHAVREHNQARPDPIRVIALYTEPERRAMFVREADEAVCIGPATFTDPADGARKNGYLDLDALERALVAAGADAVWAGWGFVAEQPRFVRLCERLGIVFIGPDADTMERIGDKIRSKLLAEEAGVPVAPWSGGPVESLDDARRHAEAIGFPLVVKASAGGGGRGIRRVNDAAELEEAFTSARAEAAVAFGDPTVFLERLITPARHVEVQVVGDGAGTAWAVGVRDCSLQRRSQKVVEESACPVFTPEQDREIREAAARLALRVGYRGAGTVEFLYRPDEQTFSFLEVNARLQVEHPVTELTTGLDLVRMQLDIAAGARLVGEPPDPTGWAVEVRLNAEDPARGFAPAPGRIELLRLPTGPGVRVDTGVAEGDTIPPEFDSMIAKVMAWGSDRDEALARLRRALAETVVVVRDGTTNQGFLLDLLDRPEVRRGEFDNQWLDRLQAEEGFVPTRHADLALIQAAVEVALEEDHLDVTRFVGWARRGRPQVDDHLARVVELRHGAHTYRLVVHRLGPTTWRVEVDGAIVELQLEQLGTWERRLHVGGDVHRVVASRSGTDWLIAIDGVPHRISRDDGGLIRTPSPAVVIAIPVAEGDEVAAGQTVAVVEAMKMETTITAPFGGRVRKVLAGTNVQVDAGAPIVQLEQADDTGTATGGERLEFVDRLIVRPDDPAERCRANHQRLEWLLLGYDVPEDEVRRIDQDEAGVCEALGVDHPGLLDGEDALLGLYADLRSLTRPAGDGDLPERSREYLHQYLRSFDPAGEGLPARYVALLERILAHYGVEGTGRSPAAEEAMYRVFRSLQRPDPARAEVLAILARRLERAETLVPVVGRGFRTVLNRLVRATQSRDDVVADLAMEVRYRYFDQPLLDEARRAEDAEIEARLRALRDEPTGPAREEHLAALVACPRPLAPLLTERLRSATGEERWGLLEVMTRRYYRLRELSGFHRDAAGALGLLVSGFEFDGHRYAVVAAAVELDGLPQAATAVARHLESLPGGQRALVDFYTEHDGALDADTLADRLRTTLEAAAFPPTLHRVVVAAARPSQGRGMSAVDVFTFRPGAAARTLVEDAALRGIHPMMGKRLQLWRLANFDCRRLPSAEDVYLFHGTARNNPRDERLFAIAEVRDMTPVRDEHGRVVALPELERMLNASLEGIRRFQALRVPAERLQWNRVLLFVWPPIDLRPEEIRELVRRIAPRTGRLGIETVVVRGRLPDGPGGAYRERVIRVSNPASGGVTIEIDDPPTEPLRPLDEYTRKVVQARRRGLPYPYELVQLLAPATDQPGGLPRGEFLEHDLDDTGERLVPVDRPPGRNTAGIVAGVVRSFTDRYPEGMTRVALFGDPTRALGSIAEPECRRIIAALDLARELRVPVEWFTLSAGAKIAMDSGTENMDWVAAVLRRLIEFTQAGGEVNVVVAGINVGAQPYWNAEATMLMHTRGILVMTPDSAMVLTGKQALEYSGAVSAEDNFGIGGYDRIMGPNGQAQYWAPDLASACRILLAHYDHGYVAPGERFPRRAHTDDPPDRDVRSFPHRAEGSEFTRVGEIFDPATNPERKKSFDIRSVMAAVVDQDHPTMERWPGMAGADTGVVWDAHLGGWPVTLIGIESRPLPRHGPLPADGPDQWTSGTLFPMSSKKIARAINATSGTRPLVVLANLSGFDGSPESMRERQLEFGAEIGRAVVNFDGPIVFCVISRYHGGAFVVFSKRLNGELEAAAVEGSRASVIGGAPAAAVVFAHEVDVRTRQDPRVAELRARLEAAEGSDREHLRSELQALEERVRAEKRGELAAEFDAVHSVERARKVGSIDTIIPAEALRPWLVEAVERGVRRTLDRLDLER